MIGKKGILALGMAAVLCAGCGGQSKTAANTATPTALAATQQQMKQEGTKAAQQPTTQAEEKQELRLVIKTGGKVLHATLEDNATARAFLAKCPVTLPMANLYDREMCYRYGAGALPAESTREDHYAVGDIVYWPPRGSFVILYKQNGELFERVQVGHIDEDVSFFAQAGDVEVTIERAQ